MIKRLLSILIVSALLLSALPLYAAAADAYEIKNGVLVRYTGTSGIVNVPNTVTAIGDSAFYMCYYISKVTLPDSVKTIGSNAFAECSNLTSVTIGKGLTVIGSQAFQDCHALKDINIPDSVEVIGGGSFENCYSLTSIKLSDGVKKIGARAFYMCIGFASMNIPKNVSAIGDSAFAGCVNLKDFTVSAENATFAAFDGVLYSKTGKTIISYPQARDGAYTLRSGTAYIASGAFEYAIGLTGLAGARDVEVVGDYAFSCCLSLRDIYLPKALGIMGFAFYNCQSLKTVRIGGAVIGQYAFNKCAALKSVIVADGSKAIDQFAFSECPVLRNVILPSSITYIGNNVFTDTPEAKVLCEKGSEVSKFFSSLGIMCAPPNAPSSWAVEILKNSDRFAISCLQLGYQGYQGNSTRYEFTLAVANFLEQYYNKGVDQLVAERKLKNGKFSDTEDLDILAVNALGLVNGTGNGLFAPENLLNREQAATLMYRIMIDILGPAEKPAPSEDEGEEEAPAPESIYKDAAKISDWAIEAVNAMTEAGIMVGDGVNFNPKKGCTREMCIIMFSRLWDVVNAAKK